jgi:hypothetical protein
MVERTAEPIGYVIRRPTEAEKGNLLLFVTRPQAGPFGTAGTGIFAVDDLVQYADSIQCNSAAGPITFSKDLPYLVVPRTLTYPVSTKDLAEIQKQEKKDWDEAYGEEEDKLNTSAVEVLEDGRVRHNAGQYL